MAIKAKKAVRQQVKLKIALIGPSGSGKTYSALRLATGLGGRILLLNTEGDRGYLYADEFEYDIADLEPPFTPERFIEGIECAENEGYNVLIIDSGSHEWSGRGGMLEVHDAMPGNSYTNWAKINPRHNAFIDKQLYSKCHIINCLRGKDQYVLEEKNGKQAPKKVGMGPEQRANYEYEFTTTFMIDQETHVATQMKDNTHLFEGKYEKLTEEHGKLLKQWAESGVEAPLRKSDVNWDAFWNEQKKIGYTQEEVLKIAGVTLDVLQTWPRSRANTLHRDLKAMKTEAQAGG
ncbi:AAA ATPase [Desulfitobacterium hafniense]|uniref:AAA ATPase n=1 Tax=Desulfitobacterium hafniense TaxID=49338 RepID=A0A098AXD5_DESHA|nr:AAA family ATPase [Desulfitobacterium hafniense]CDX01263.1 AAA ATPase [Desulfitobacterium hafniense]